MGPSGKENEERLCFRGPVAIYPTDRIENVSGCVLKLRYQTTTKEDMEYLVLWLQ